MTPTPHIRFPHRLIAVAIATVAAVAPTVAHAMPADNAHGAALKAQVVKTDLRMPDTRDAADGLSGTSSATPSTPTRVIVPVTHVDAPKSGFDWSDAGVGAGIALLVALLAGTGIALSARRRPRRALVS